MAERPVFVPLKEGRRLFSEVPVDFTWNPGMAPSQKKKNVSALHEAAKSRGLNHLLEISSKSDREVGRRLSAFHQKLRVHGKWSSLESAYQSSKVFEFGGPFLDILEMDPKLAKRDERLKSHGRLIRFEFEGEEFPLNPSTAFYDWLYLNAIYPERDWLERLKKMDGFTDIEFNPTKSVNCQARSCAIFVSLILRDQLDDAIESFGSFSMAISASSL